MTMPIMLFAAGKGTRMKELTMDRPKPMIEVAGRPLIDHALALVEGSDLHPKVANLHYLPDVIRTHLADSDVTFSDETEALLETGGGLKNALPLLSAGPVVTLNTDAVWNGPNPIKALQEAWQPEMEALLLVVPKQNVHGHLGAGDFRIDNAGRLHRAPELIYTGAQIINPAVLSEIGESAFSMNLAWDIIAQRRGLFGLIYEGQWCDVGQPSSIPIAEAMLHV